MEKLTRFRWLRFRAVLALIGCVASISGCGGTSVATYTTDVDRALEIRELVRQSESADGGATSAAVVGTGWATLEGVVRFEGTAPERARLPVNKDVEVCTAEPEATLSPALIVDSGTQGVKNCVFYLRKASRVHESKQGPGGEEAIFDQKHCEFLSHVLGLYVGQEMKILNSDPVGHNTKIDAVAGLSFNQNVAAGDSITYVPAKEESLPIRVSCSIHPWMSAWLLPRGNGYFGVTETDGSFRIENLPAGEELEFQIWHESGGGRSGALAAVQSDTISVAKNGRFKIKLTEGETRQLELVVTSASFQ